ncbi:hypothetical protein GCM10009628_40300 [Paeniglutamicibacter kerguelensis]
MGGFLHSVAGTQGAHAFEPIQIQRPIPLERTRVAQPRPHFRWLNDEASVFHPPNGMERGSLGFKCSAGPAPA